jgi:hypothetical protein
MTPCTLQLTPTHTVSLSLNGTALTLTEPDSQVEVAFMGMPGLPGRDGVPGAAASISTDPDNRLTTGTDNGIFSPEWSGADPLAYYILAKA